MTKKIITYWTHWQQKLTTGHAPWPSLHGPDTWSPNADMYEGPDGLVIKVELAGVQMKDIRVDLNADGVVIHGIRRDPYSGETAAGYRFRQMEIEYGAFRRELPLPHPVDGRRARAQFVNGVLEINLPRTRTARPKSVSVVLES